MSIVLSKKAHFVKYKFGMDVFHILYDKEQFNSCWYILVREPVWIKPALLTITLVFLAVFIFIPLITIFKEALGNGVKTYFSVMKEPDVFGSIKLTLLKALICVPVNTVFGVLMAWAVTKFNFRFKDVLITMVEIPYAISPVVAGLLFIFLFGSFGWFGPWLLEHNLKIVFAVPGIFIATAFVTFPFVAKELIPLMRELGRDDEEAAMTPPPRENW